LPFYLSLFNLALFNVRRPQINSPASASGKNSRVIFSLIELEPIERPGGPRLSRLEQHVIKQIIQSLKRRSDIAALERGHRANPLRRGLAGFVGVLMSQEQ
jgi:hypothetical protein